MTTTAATAPSEAAAAGEAVGSLLAQLPAALPGWKYRLQTGVRGGHVCVLVSPDFAPMARPPRGRCVGHEADTPQRALAEAMRQAMERH